MTVTYNCYVATAAHLRTFYKVLVWWRGSVWKLVGVELGIWYALAIGLAVLDRYVIMPSRVSKPYHEYMEWLQSSDTISTLLPFLLGFTSSFCFGRWFLMFNCIHWPYNTAHLLNTFMRSHKLTSRMNARIRNTFARHIILAYTLLFRDVSLRVRRLYPTYEDLIKHKLMTTTELQMLLGSRLPATACHYWIPIQWIIVRIREMRGVSKHDSLMSDHQSAEFFKEFANLRGNLGDILSYDWVPMPIAYVQIIMFIVYSNMFLKVAAVQPPPTELDYFVTVWSFIWTGWQALVYLGWLRSVEVIVNPFGDDDDDFETTWLLENHRAVLHELLESGASSYANLPSKPTKEAKPHRPLPHTIGSMLMSHGADLGSLMGSIAEADELVSENNSRA